MNKRPPATTHYFLIEANAQVVSALEIQISTSPPTHKQHNFLPVSWCLTERGRDRAINQGSSVIYFHKRQHKLQPSSGHHASVKATVEMLLSPWLGGKKAQVLPKIPDSAAKLVVAKSPCHLAVVFADIPWGSPLSHALVMCCAE